jgi:uncharacterized protein YndB with AHSA1/START domain
MIKIEHSLLIAREVTEVFEALTDFAGEPRWQPEVLEAGHRPVGPVAVGTVTHQIQRAAGQRVTRVGEVVEYIPNRRLVMKSAPGGPPPAFRTTYELAPEGEGTRLRFTLEFEASEAFWLFEALIRRNLRSDAEDRFNRLKGLLEGSS